MTLLDTIQSLKLSWPEVTEEGRIANEEARRQLESEKD